MLACMNVTELHRKLIAAARSHPPSDKVPFAFEKRVIAHLTSAHVTDLWAAWAAALWRAAVPCVAITVLFTAWTLLANNRAPINDLSQDLDNTVLAAAVQDQTQSIW